MMQRVLIILIVIFALAGVGLLVYNRYRSSQNEPRQATKTKHFGALVRAYGMNKPYSPYQHSQMTAQLDYLQQLGATDSRANIEMDQTVDGDFVTLSSERGLTPTLILEPPQFYETYTYDSAFTLAKDYASRFKGKVRYYQLANEASGVAIKPSFPGNRKSDYDETKYHKMKILLQGLSDGVAAGDAEAQRIVSSNWLGTAVIDRLVEDKLEFEVIGWNWYSDMGDSLIKKLDDGSSLDIPSALKKHQKEFWVVESNRKEGTFDQNETAQADYLKTFISSTLDRTDVNGFFIFTLTDQCDSLDKQHGRLGLIGLTKNDDGSCSGSGKKKAFNTVKTQFQRYK